MSLPDLTDAALMAKRGREATLFRERKQRLEKLRGLMSKFLDIAVQGAPAVDVAKEITALTEEVDQINNLMRQ